LRTEKDELLERSKSIGRRSFIGGTMAAAMAATALGQNRDYSQGAAPVRYSPESPFTVAAHGDGDVGSGESGH